MFYNEIVEAVEKLKKRHHESDPFRLCRDMGITLLLPSLGTDDDAIKGFYLEAKRIKTITINSDLPEIIQRFIMAHELGHAVLHKKSGVHTFRDIGLFDESSIYEKDANLFAAEYLLDDTGVLETLNGDNTFFTAAATLCVPPELLDFKFRILRWKGHKLLESPINARSNFLRDLDVPYGTDSFYC